jgi:ureidoacrylate peracid hydrolase
MGELGSTHGNVWTIALDTIDTARALRLQRRVRIDAKPKPAIIDLAATAILVIDMQNRFCRESRDRMGDLPTAKPIAPLQALLPHLRSNGVPVVWLNWGNREDKLNIAPGIMYAFAREGAFRPPMLDKGSWDAEIVAPLKAEADDIHIDKYRISGFFDSELDSVLRNLRITTLLFAGVNTDQCVNATLVDAHCLGYDCVLVADCAATRSPAFCTEAVLYNVERGLGFVTDSAALMGAAPA